PGRSDRLHAQTPHYPQRDDPRQPTMGRNKPLTKDTAAVRSAFVGFPSHSQIVIWSSKTSGLFWFRAACAWRF
ncbi:MAG: hypothetical protein ABI488_19840, partial [Polyangiaceae bacterium]